MSEINVGLGEVVETVGRERAVAHYSIRVSERFFSKLNALCFGSSKKISTEVTVAYRNRPSLPVIVRMSLNKRGTGAEVSINIVIALRYTVRRLLVIVKSQRNIIPVDRIRRHIMPFVC